MSLAPPPGVAPESPLVGLAPLARLAFEGGDLRTIGTALLARTTTNPWDANAWMDLSMIAHLAGNRELGLAMQEQALSIRRLFRLDAAGGAPALRVLALLVPGDLTQNNALEFLLEGSDVRLDLLYVTPETTALPDPDEYDLTVVGVGESDRNRSTLEHLVLLLRSWPVPVLDAPEWIARLSRETAAPIVGDVPGVVMPHTTRLDRATLAAIGAGELSIDERASGARFPLLIRPVDSHKGRGLARVDSDAEIAAYLDTQPDAAFHVVPFIEYRGADGRYWKYRIVFIDGEPYLCHVAISSHYVVHYMSAGMAESEEKRALEAEAMASFDSGFAARHREALARVAERLGLAYVGIDCGETPDGELLIFEADASLTVHAMDPVDLHPYKQPQMRRVFAAFRQLLLSRASRVNRA